MILINSDITIYMILIKSDVVNLSDLINSDHNKLQYYQKIY